MRDKGNKGYIEGTDWLLIVMPETQRRHGNVLAYLVPTAEAVAEVRRTHRDWLATNPNTKGGNTTWNLWFDPDGPGKAKNYAQKWKKYRLEGTVSTVDFMPEPPPRGARAPRANGALQAEVNAFQNRVAVMLGVPTEAVKVSIELNIQKIEWRSSLPDI